jgi:hypothetical protein
MELCIEYLFIVLFILINIRSDECGRIFCYRENGTRFHKDHVEVKDGSGRKTVPVWACFLPTDQEISSALTADSIVLNILIFLENYLLPNSSALPWQTDEIGSGSVADSHFSRGQSLV